jgi:hypothetical protein
MLHTSSERPATVDEGRVNRDSRRRLLLVVAGFAVVAFLVTELMRYLLVADLGPYRERIMAEGGSALILGLLVAKLLQNAYRARQQAEARLRVIAEVNHHVRNALELISLSAYITRDEEAIRRISEGVNRIDWALREVLPRESFPQQTEEPRQPLSTSGAGGEPRAPNASPGQPNSRLERVAHDALSGSLP